MYYKNVLEDPSSSRLVDLNRTPPSELALEGTLAASVLAAMYSRPIEFDGATKTIDLFKERPRTMFSDQVSSLQSFGLTPADTEHAFFLKCYMQFPADASFCQNGTLDNTLSIVSLPAWRISPPQSIGSSKKSPKNLLRPEIHP
jgi:hypothetical protein